MKDTTKDQNTTTTSHSPLKEQRTSILFMLFLLIISGVTASVVGYRVKSADLDRKAQLLKLYEGMGGSFEKAHALGTTLLSPDRPREQNVFIGAYEINCRVRGHGLYHVLETTRSENMPQLIEALYAIKAFEAARSTEDAWRAYQQPSNALSPESTVKPNSNPKAIRFSKQYDRYLARDTEVKLFRYVRDTPTIHLP